MSERTHSSSSDSFSTGSKPAHTRQRTALLLVGTTAAVLIAGVAFQVFRPEEAVSREETSQANSATGKTSLGNRSKPYARVNGQYITYDQIARECFERYGKEMLDNIINRTIIQQACEQQGIEVSQAEIDAEIVRIAKQLNLDVAAWYEFLQVERGVTPGEVRRDRIWPKLALQKLAGKKIEVTQQQMQDGYLRLYGPRVEGRMIMLNNVRHAQEVWEKVRKNPEDFSKLAQEYSIDRNSSSLGGVIPPIHRFSSTPNLEIEAFKLKDGEISAIVQVGVGHVIFMREGMTTPNVPYDEVKETLYEQMIEEKTQVAVAHVFEKARKEARVDNYMTNTSTAGVRQVSGNQTSGRVRNATATQPSGSRSSR